MHYYLTTLPVVTLLVAFLVWFVLKQGFIAPKLLIPILLLGAAYFSLPLSNFGRLAEKFTSAGVIVEDKESVLAERVREETEPGDRILVWGKAVRINLLSDRDAPSRFFYHHPLVEPHYTTQAMRDEFVLDLKNEMPVLIIDSRFMWFAPLNRSERAGWQPHDSHMHKLADFEPFFDFVGGQLRSRSIRSGPSRFYALRLSDSEIATTAQRRVDCPLQVRCLPGRQNTHLRKEPVRPR